MGIGVLGPLTINGTEAASAGLGPRDRTVLAALVVSGDDALSVDQLAEAMWGERPPASWRKVLHGCVARLRRVLGPQAIRTVATGYRVGFSADDIDARRFERQLGRSWELLTLGEPDRALFTLDEALALWRGRALVDVEGWEPGRIEAGRLDELRLDAEELRVDAALRAGRHREVLAEARARVAEAPLRERRWALLALAQYRAGRQGEALATLRRARATLRSELGLDPGDDLIAIEQGILRHDPSLSTPDDLPAPSDRCPYLGLLAYDVPDAEAFFGRDADVTACLDRLAAAGVLSVVGASGSGKSSLVRAGLAAALRRDGRQVVIVTPGHRPTEALASVPGPGGVLIVDQCEEVFALCDDPAERSRFLTGVADCADRGTLVVLAMRADRFSEASAEPRFARLVERGLYMLAAMGETDLRSAIEGPAHQAGELLEPGLVDILVRDVAGEPGALPLLSHALRQTWQRREGRTLTVAGYHDTGGIRGAVANTAEEVYDHLPPEQRPLLRDLMLRLVVPMPDGEPSRGRVPRRTVAAGPAQESMIERLVAARLVTSDEGVVELAHEAIARAWPRLRSWLDDDADGLRIRRHLSVAADAWDAMGRPDSETYRGTRLARALDWRDRGRPDLTPVEDAFLDAGRTLATAEQRRTVRENRRLRTLLAAAAVLLLVAGGAGVLAVRQANRATAAATAADARRIGGQAVGTPELDRAALLAVQGTRMDDTKDTRASLLATLNRAPALIGVIHCPPRTTPGYLEVSSDGRSLVVLDGRRIGVYDTSSRAGRWESPDVSAQRPGGAIGVRSDGAEVAIANRTSFAGWAVSLIGVPGLVAHPTPPKPLPVPTERGGILYGPDGKLYLTSYSPAIVRVWDVHAQESVARINMPWQTDSARFGPDRRLLHLVSANARQLAVYDLDRRGIVRRLDLPGRLLDMSPDGRLLAITGAPSRPGAEETAQVVLLDAVTGRSLARLSSGGHEAVERARFSHDGRTVAATTSDGTVLLWTVATGRVRDVLTGHIGVVTSIAFSPDDTTLYTGGQDGTILIWDVKGDRRFISRRTAIADSGQASGFGAAVAPDGRSAVLTWIDQGQAWWRVADLATGRAGPAVAAHRARIEAVWRPDGTRFATTGGDGRVRLWDPRTNALVADVPHSHENLSGIGFSRVGMRLFVSDQRFLTLDSATLNRLGDELRLLNARGGRMVVGPGDRTAVVLNDVAGSTPNDPIAFVDLATGRIREYAIGLIGVAAAFSPDGARLAIAGQGGEILLLDVASGTAIGSAVAAHSRGATAVAFSADGRVFVSGGRDGRVALWDGRTGDALGAVTVAGSGVATYPGFRHDGHTAVVVGSDGSVHTWDTDPRAWIAFACELAGRDLTAAEWDEAIGDREYRPTCPRQLTAPR